MNSGFITWRPGFDCKILNLLTQLSIDWSPFNSFSAYSDRYRVLAIASIYSIHIDVMTDVVKENTHDTKRIF